MSQENLSLWNKVCETDPDMTEKISFGAYKFTTIDAQSQIQKATEVFGPFGIGWRVTNGKYEVIVPYDDDKHYNLLAFTGRFEYQWQDRQGHFDISAEIELFEYNKKNSEWRRTSDAYKKVYTDALTKALSRLGFNADVFLGKFDDNKYVDSLHRKKETEAGAANAEQLSKIQELATNLELRGDQFAEYLRTAFKTSWSRITKELADKIIIDLQNKKPFEKKQVSEIAASEPEKPKADPSDPEVKTEPESKPETKKKLVPVPKKPDDYYAGLSDDEMFQVNGDKDMSEKVLLNQTARDMCNSLYKAADDKDAIQQELSKILKDLTGSPTLANNAIGLLKLSKRKLEALVKTLKAKESN